MIDAQKLIDELHLRDIHPLWKEDAESALVGLLEALLAADTKRRTAHLQALLADIRKLL